MAEVSVYLTNNILDYVLRGTSFTAPSTLYLALYNGDPLGTGTEVDTPDYGRETITFDAPANGESVNATDIQFTEATNDWGNISYIGIYDDSLIQADVSITSLSTSGADFTVSAVAGGAYEGAAGNDVTVEFIDSGGTGGLNVTLDGATDTISIDFDGDATATAASIVTLIDDLVDFTGTVNIAGDFTAADDVGQTATLTGGVSDNILFSGALLNSRDVFAGDQLRFQTGQISIAIN